MSRLRSDLTLRPNPPPPHPSLRECAERAGLRRGAVASLPFLPGDVTAGSETELQVAVIGSRETVDLPLAIERSSYFANVVRRTAAGDTSPQVLSELEAYLADNPERVWEGSWVRFPVRLLSPLGRQVLERDLAADKERPDGPRRGDHERFFLRDGSEGLVRLPISYLLKLALAEVAADGAAAPARRAAERRMACFSNDNSSPETLSFHLVDLAPAHGGGRAVAVETAQRYLFTQLLVLYANEKLELRKRGQEVAVFYSPHPPQRQRQLNRTISDAFYRELFVSPCLSGWQRGEDKHEYMRLCHQVLSRSQLQAVTKLREAGINLSNLVVLPHTSNLALANNGTHVSLGSRRLSALRQSDPSFTAAHEKSLGDLVLKVSEHFLPLFVGTLSAAPYRLGFADLHPEQVLGFLPHQLDFTHLRMLWRCWRTKAQNRVFGRSLTPFGPPLLDRAAAGLFGLRGDFVPDFRLIDYPVALMSTETSPALDGRLGNTERLKRDLDALGVIDSRMALYLPLRLREQAVHGFAGVEARSFSLFASFAEDLGRAVDLQHLVTAFAWQRIADGAITHAQIPDRPSIESERRQLFFAAALGVQRVYVRSDTPNVFLREILEPASGVRPSRRYPGYLEVGVVAFQRALLRKLRREAAPLVEALGVGATLADLETRLGEPERGLAPAASASGKLTRGILAEAGGKDPMRLDAASFNRAAERFYRGELRGRHLAEAIDLLTEELAAWESAGGPRDGAVRTALGELLGGTSPAAFVRALRPALLADRLRLREVRQLLHLLLLAAEELETHASATEPLNGASWDPTPTWTAVPVAS